jgi:hypothetical protein
MSKLGQFVLLRSRIDWEQACRELAAELAQQPDVSSVSVEFASQPLRYPCLVASVPVPQQPLQAGCVSQTQLMTSFVYIEDAERLVAAREEAETDVPIDYVQDRSPAASPQYTPSPLASLALALVHELKAVGVLRQDKLFDALRRSEDWLRENQQDNAELTVEKILERFWEDHHAR